MAENFEGQVVKNVFITGADGYLGSRLARYFINKPEYILHLWVRAEDKKEFESKKNRLLGAIPDAYKRCRF